MLDVSLSSLVREIRAGDAVMEENLRHRQRMLERYAGMKLEGGSLEQEFAEAGEVDTENQGVSWLLLFKARVAFNRPKIDIKSMRRGLSEVHAKALDATTNRWMREAKIRELIDLGADDYGFNHCVTMLTRELAPGPHDPDYPTYWPRLELLSPRDVGVDALALRLGHVRIIWNKYPADLNELIEIAEEDKDLPPWESRGWNLDVLKSMQMEVDTEGEDLARPSHMDHPAQRGEVVLRNVYVGEYTLPWVKQRFEREGTTPEEQGFYGTMFTVAMSLDSDDEFSALDAESRIDLELDDSEVLPIDSIDELVESQAIYMPRRPFPYFGAPGGPYDIIGALSIPDRAIPVGPLSANEPGIVEVNRANTVISKRMRKRKTGVAYDLRHTQAAQAIHEAYDGAFVGIPFLGEEGGKLQPFEIGGASAEDFAYRDDRRAAIQRNLGMSDALEGQGDPDISATADNISATSSASRMEVLATKYLRGWEKVIEKAARMIHNDPDFDMVIGDGKYSAVFIGGRPTEDRVRSLLRRHKVELDEASFEHLLTYLEANTAFEDLELVLDLTSTQRETPQLRMFKAGQAVQLMQTVVPTAPAIERWFNVGSVLEQVCDHLGIPWFAAAYDQAAAREAGQALGDPVGGVAPARYEVTAAGRRGTSQMPLVLPNGGAPQHPRLMSGQSSGASAGGQAAGQAKQLLGGGML